MAFVVAFLEMMQLLAPVGVAFVFGIMIGWAWKPRWANGKFGSSAPPSSSSPPSSSPPLISPDNNSFDSTSSSDSCKLGTASDASSVTENGLEKEHKVLPSVDKPVYSASNLGKEDEPIITDKDLEYLCHLVERKDGGPPWKHVMDRSAQNMSYQAWQRDLEGGPPQYCSRTVYEDATPEMLRDFFWDDEFRLKWDNMVSHASIIEECPTTGTMVVHWIKKFPFFCSDREYIIGRRIWELGRSYYCVTMGVPSSSVPKREKPLRVDKHYSSWFIQSVESIKGNGQLSACEVILFHYEDMGIPGEIVKFGARQGMWGAVKNVERGFRAYQKHRASGAPLSHHAFMAQINTKLDPDYLRSLEGDEISPETELVELVDEKPKGCKIPKLLIIGGVIAVACSLDRGLLTKTLIFGVARRFSNMGGKGCPGNS